MSNKVLFLMTGLVVACIIVLLVLNAIPLIWTPSTEKYLKFNEVRGVAVEHKDKLYTLNFNQQNDLIGYLNKSVPISTQVTEEKPKLEVSKIVIYLFGSPDIEIIPIEYRNNDLIFSSPDWNRSGLMKDMSGGAMKKLLSQTYDP